MIKKICSLILRYQTKNFKKIPLFTMTFNYQKYKKNGEKGSCILYAIHPDIRADKFLQEKLSECVDHIRENYDMEMFTKM